MDYHDYQRDRGRHPKQGWRYHPFPDDDESNHHRTHGGPPGDNATGEYRQPRGWGRIGDRLSGESLISGVHLQTKSSHHRRGHSTSLARASRTSRTSCHRIDPAPKKRSKSEHAMGNAISTAAEVAFRIRNDSGSWVGEKGIKVASAAIASATIDLLLDTDPKKHPLAHMAVSMVQGAVKDGITDSKTKVRIAHP
ncbi:hypothetical protein B0J15DRAFT_505240 [Fusarium solani]|uniref:Uncharacterized protein n=1 Tax=Fusarium solani TaxID=169388 RepID=A0A9P9JPQ6_FUSSL|nr:uncharacterized protein B0J15DRAFT_505240 [Fusarium solani]KAH7232438.1 hypothetical protein B0J15DRAFT_505240 [Fusarium solani]